MTIKHTQTQKTIARTKTGQPTSIVRQLDTITYTDGTKRYAYMELSSEFAQPTSVAYYQRLPQKIKNFFQEV